MLKLPRPTILNHCGHRLERAVLGLGQPMHISPRHDRAGSNAILSN